MLGSTFCNKRKIEEISKRRGSGRGERRETEEGEGEKERGARETREVHNIPKPGATNH